MSTRQSILFIEDEEALLTLIVDDLQKEFDVAGVTNGEEALKYIANNEVDCIVLDLKLPGMSGIEFLKTIRDNGDDRDVIITTGQSSLPYAEQCADLCVKGYITKPYTICEITNKLKKLINLKNEKGVLTCIETSGVHPKLRRALSFIRKNYHNLISLQDLSHRLDITPDYLGQLFKCTTGETFTWYVNSVRLEKAKDILISSDLPIKKVMARVGFRSPQYFFEVFKKHTGTSPNKYRNSHGE